MKLILVLAAVTLVTGSPLRLAGRDFHEVSCSICQHLTQDIHHVLSNHDTQNAVVSGLKDRCESLVQEQTEVCHEMVDNMAPNMVHFLSNRIHPYIMCSSMEVCPEEHIDEQTVQNHEQKPQEHEQEPQEHEEKVDMCEFCQFAINIVERYAHANGSIAKLNETFTNFCNNLPDALKSECLQFEPAVINALAEGIPPHQACVKAHVCPGSSLEGPQIWRQVTCDLCNRVSENMFAEDAGAVCMDMRICIRPTQPATEVHEPEVEHEVEEKEGAGPGCELCQFVVNTIDTYLKDNHTEAAINATITKLCNELPEPLKDTCNGFAPQLIQILAQGFDPKQACTKIGLCESAQVLEPVEEIPKAGPGCELCQFVVNVIDQYLQNNKSEEAINATITKICNELPEPLKDTCNGFAPQLVKILSEGLDPKEACSKIRLCEASKEPAHYKFTEEEFERLQAGPGCELCQFVVNTIDTYLKDNHTEAAINATVTKFCNELPEPLKDTCNGFAPQLIKILAEGFDPQQACTKIGLCATEESVQVEEDASEEREETPEEVELPREPEIELSAGPGCELCQFVVNTIDTYLKDNHTEAAINATVTKFCNELPEPLKDTCNGFAPQLIKILAEGFDPQQACTKIGLCASQAEAERYMPHPEALKEILEAPKPEEHVEIPEEHVEVPEEHVEVPEELAAGPGCELCQFVVNTIDTYLKDNHTEAAINATITKLCNDLPEPLKDTCNGFAPQLIKILAQGFDPKQACTKIGLCATGENVEHALKPEEEHPVEEEEHHLEEEEHQVLAGPGCELCQFVVNTIDTYLKDNHTEAAINATITKLCNSLPEPLKDTCNGFAPQLIKILAEGFDPKQACTKVGLCSGNSQIQDGEEKVTPECHLCELVVGSVDRFLRQNSTDAYVNTTILRVCLGLPEPLKSTCLKFAPDLVEALSQGLDPNKTCERIKLCTANEVAVYQHVTCEVCESSLEKTFPKEFKKVCAVTCGEKQPVTEGMEELAHGASVVLKKPKSALTCELCTLLVKTLDTYLKDNHSEAAINSTIYKICASLPSALQLECHLMAPLLVKQLANGFNASKACTAIHACDAEKEVQLARLSRSIQEGALQGKAECAVCKGLIGFIDKGIDGDEGKAKKQFDDVCHRLPPPTDQKCLDFVDPNFPKIWNEIVNGKLSPESVCKALKVCT